MALQEIALLYEAAQTLDAAEVMRFLHGLEILLANILYKRVKLAPQRFEAIASRVEALLPIAQRCVEEGRAERASIEEVLTRLMSTFDRPPKFIASVPVSR